MEMIIIIAIMLIIIAFFLGRKLASVPIENNNNKIKEELEQLQEQKDIQLKELEILAQTKKEQEVERQHNLDKLDSDLSWKWTEIHNAEDKLKWIEHQYQDKLQVINNTEELAKNAYEAKTKEYAAKLLQEEESFQNIIQKHTEEINLIQEKLESYKATKAAAIEAARREKQVEENKDEYCLILPKEEERDIPLLREVQYKVSKPRAVAMCIWSNYYLPIAKEKLPKILGKQDVCGIYKITNLKTGECYIGQARDVKKRIYEHMRAGLGVDTPQGNQLYQAMKEYGLDDFSIELLEECDSAELNKKEKYFIDLYQSNIVGYNISGGNNG